MEIFSWEIWAVFLGIVASFVLFDLGFIANSAAKTLSAKVAASMTALVVFLAMLFACLIGYYSNWHYSALFVTGYLVELSLSVDNIFVFILLFNTFQVSPKGQHKVLVIGIMSAILMRLLMISGGIYIVKQFQWAFYIFGAFLVYSGIKILLEIGKDEKKDVSDNKVLKALKRFLPIYDGDSQDQFFVVHNGKKYVTHLFIVMLLIEQVDLVFALDSIPAILAITDDVFIVFTSNIFAILGLRSMYFFLADILEKFAYIKHALSVILLFIGLKMIAAVQGFHIDIAISLIVIITSILCAILFSIYKKNKML